jgi:hypothetical protein
MPMLVLLVLLPMRLLVLLPDCDNDNGCCFWECAVGCPGFGSWMHDTAAAHPYPPSGVWAFGFWQITTRTQKHKNTKTQKRIETSSVTFEAGWFMGKWATHSPQDGARARSPRTYTYGEY